MAAVPPANNSSITSTGPTTPFSSTVLPTESSTTPPSSTLPSSSDTAAPSSSLTSETIPPSETPSSSSELPTSSIESVTTPTTSSSPVVETSVVTRTPSNGNVVIETSTSTQAVSTTPPATTSSSATEAAASASSSTNPALASGSGSGDDGGLKQGPKIAIAVVVPVVVIALLILAGLWFWKKRKQTKDAEDLRRKEMEEYGFNPNNDPTVPAVGGSSTNGDETLTVREQDAGYRGWGGTTASNTRKASTTMSSNPGMARSDSGGNAYKSQNSPTGNMTQVSDGHSGDPLVGHGDETIGALGAAPAASANRGGVNRGPSNASSAYSAANRSDVSAMSGDGPLPNGSPPYPQDYMYPDESNQHGWDGQPVIREVSARRNTRIENPSIVPQQGNAGIAQNF